MKENNWISIKDNLPPKDNLDMKIISSHHTLLRNGDIYVRQFEYNILSWSISKMSIPSGETYWETIKNENLLWQLEDDFKKITSQSESSTPSQIGA